MLQRIGYGLSAALAMLFLTPLAQAQTVIGQDRDVVTRFIGPEGLSLLVLIAVVLPRRPF